MKKEIEYEINSLVHKLCMQTGLNTAHDYDGIESEEDIVIYLKALLKMLPQKGLKDKYFVTMDTPRPRFSFTKKLFKPKSKEITLGDIYKEMKAINSQTPYDDFDHMEINIENWIDFARGSGFLGDVDILAHFYFNDIPREDKGT